MKKKKRELQVYLPIARKPTLISAPDIMKGADTKGLTTLSFSVHTIIISSSTMLLLLVPRFFSPFRALKKLPNQFRMSYSR